jgi:hypothetical protein
VRDGIRYLEEEKGIPKELTVETIHSTVSLLSAVSVARIAGATLKTGTKTLPTASPISYKNPTVVFEVRVAKTETKVPPPRPRKTYKESIGVTTSKLTSAEELAKTHQLVNSWELKGVPPLSGK